MFVGTDSFGNFVGRVSRLLNHGVNTSDYSFGAQYLSWFLLAAFIFVVLRILGQIRALKAALCQLVGSAVFVVPIVGRMPIWAAIPDWLRWVGGAVAAGAALLYANRTRPTTGALLAAAALFHFAPLAFVFFRDVGLGGLESVAESPILPLVGSMVWAIYVWLRR
jgi:hypothetical protein